MCKCFQILKKQIFHLPNCKLQPENIYGIGRRFKLKLIAKKFFPKYKGQFFQKLGEILFTFLVTLFSTKRVHKWFPVFPEIFQLFLKNVFFRKDALRQGREHWLKGKRLSTFDLLIKAACFVKVKIVFALTKATHLN
jgi:hypothetical protein